MWDVIDGTRVLLAPFSRTMSVNGKFDLALSPDPPAPEKFGHHDPNHPRALVETAEEWVLYNCSISLWSHTDKAKFKQPGQYALHYRAFPIGRADGQARFARDPEFQITTKGADHPFHIHVNPCWVTRIDVPDEHGPAPQHPRRAPLDGHRVHSARRPGGLSIPIRGLRRQVGESLSYPHARGPRDDAGGRGRWRAPRTRTTIRGRASRRPRCPPTRSIRSTRHPHGS